MIQVQEQISLRRQCEPLAVGRSGLYYEPVGTSTEALELMRRIDVIHLQWPFYGSRKLCESLRNEGTVVNRKHMQRLMRLMGLESVAPKPDRSKPHPEHPVFPYLLRNLAISQPNQVWATDITYIPMAHGFAYLVAIIDWYSRRVLAWRLSNTLESRFCVEALQEALERFPKPTIFNTDQGSQFTPDAFTSVLRGAGITISMDGRGRCIDNVFVPPRTAGAESALRQRLPLGSSAFDLGMSARRARRPSDCGQSLSSSSRLISCGRRQRRQEQACPVLAMARPRLVIRS
jgi:putative transposase